MSIFVLAYVYYDGDNYRQESIDPELGYYTTREAAEQWVRDTQERIVRPVYERHVAALEAQQERYDTAFETAQRRWLKLVELVDNPWEFMVEPVRPVPVRIPEFAEYARQGGDEYVVIELEQAK